ncbi:MAG: PH domain-containing protein [Vicinamibacterales bacterium]
MADEEVIWEGRPSQWTNFWAFAAGILLCWLVVPLVYAIVAYLRTRARGYTLTSQRLFLSEGVLTRRTDELELFRVRDTVVVEPFLMRLIGLGNVIINTNDVTTPTIVIQAVAKPRQVREFVRNTVESRRKDRRVGVMEVS